jgi:hypothetical protein
MAGILQNKSQYFTKTAMEISAIQEVFFHRLFPGNGEFHQSSRFSSKFYLILSNQKTEN